tara:strand:- start:496 stop:741 length:246 start_codon:yes stop_codon:yes gene_type:complete
MNLNSSSFDISVLKGALLTNTNGAEFRIVGFSFHASNPTEILVNIREHDMETGELLEGTTSIAWASLSDWDLQIQAGEGYD